MITKNKLRNEAKEIRKKLNIVDISKRINEKFLSLPEYSNSKNIFCYYSFGHEVVTHDLFSIKEKNWYIPKIKEKSLEVCLFDKEKLIANKYGIKEQVNPTCIMPDSIDIAILPALMADKSGHRLGYGKGYYDRFLNEKCNAFCKIIFIPEELLRENLITEKHDCPANIIITQCNIYRINHQ